MTVQASQ